MYSNYNFNNQYIIFSMLKRESMEGVKATMDEETELDGEEYSYYFM